MRPSIVNPENWTLSAVQSLGKSNKKYTYQCRVCGEEHTIWNTRRTQLVCRKCNNIPHIPSSVAASTSRVFRTTAAPILVRTADDVIYVHQVGSVEANELLALAGAELYVSVKENVFQKVNVNIVITEPEAPQIPYQELLGPAKIRYPLPDPFRQASLLVPRKFATYILGLPDLDLHAAAAADFYAKHVVESPPDFPEYELGEVFTYLDTEDYCYIYLTKGKAAITPFILEGVNDPETVKLYTTLTP
jgi:hypothetical protein